ncbi:MAG TPA: hypothetical protein VK133_00875 [Amoebophilaceae bacterium]|nr:hypothetical protein [Amoebophilaceae bacterium]
MLYNPNPLVYTGLICAALLYDLPNHTAVSRLFLRAHYDQATYAFIQAMASIQGMQLPNPASLFRVAAGAKKSYLRKELAALYIKLVEHVHDLKHAAGYVNKTTATEMAPRNIACGRIACQSILSKHQPVRRTRSRSACCTNTGAYRIKQVGGDALFVFICFLFSPFSVLLTGYKRLQNQEMVPENNHKTYT